jgi:hypothetical protein
MKQPGITFAEHPLTPDQQRRYNAICEGANAFGTILTENALTGNVSTESPPFQALWRDLEGIVYGFRGLITQTTGSTRTAGGG